MGPYGPHFLAPAEGIGAFSHSPFGQINIAVLKIVLHKPMTEQLSVEVNVKKPVPSAF